MDAVFEQILRQADTFLEGAFPQAEAFIDHRRVIEQKMAFAAGRAVLIDDGHGFPGQLFGQFPRIANRCRSQDKLRAGPVELRYALQAPNDVRHMRAKNAPVGVHFVDDHKAQMAEKIHPVGVMRQNAGMEHIGVGKNQPRRFTDGGTFGGWSIPIINRGGSGKLLLQT